MRLMCIRTVLIGLLVCLWIPAAAEEPWRGTLGEIGSAIVSIEVDVPVAFETSSPLNSEATGFVVDAERGLILTNRHVIQAGPVSARAIFPNQEEVTLEPVYRDPIHDFGFFRYDPSSLRSIEPVAIALRPDKARVGTAIRLIGNDAGERFSILDSTLARLSRNAPEYGDAGYNDFNTFYLQASSAATGGSSGSPVLNENGEAIGLQAAGRFLASTNYYLPLDRVVYAMDYLIRGEQPPRGDLLVSFTHESYDQLARLGLTHDQIEALRSVEESTSGGLVVDQVQPGGPADGVLRPGDVLLAVDGQPVVHFVALAIQLDQASGQSVELQFARGGEETTAEVEVVDLQALMPDRYVQISDAVIHPLSYQQARHLRAPVDGLVLNSRGYMFRNAGVGPGALLQAINGEPIEDLDHLIAQFESLADGEDFRLSYRQSDPPYNTRVAVVTMDRRWHPARQCRADGAHWQCQPLADVPAYQREPSAGAPAMLHSDPALQELLPALVRVSYFSPFSLDGVSASVNSATGLILDAEAGLVVVDRNTVPKAVADIFLTFAGSVRVPGEVAWLHPLHNLALLRFDPADMGDTPISSARLASTLPDSGDAVRAAGLVQNFQIRQHQGTVLEYFPLPESRMRSARFVDRDLMVLTLEQTYFLDSGVFLNAAGEVVAVIATYDFGRGGSRYSWGIPVDIVDDLLQRYRDEGRWRSLELDLGLVGFDLGQRLEVPTEWLERIEQEGSGKRELLQVDQVFATGQDRPVKAGDLLLAIDGEPVNSFRAVERASQAEQLRLTLVRDGQLLEVNETTVALPSRGSERLLLWAGATLQEPHRELRLISGEQRGLYINDTAVGSPGQRARLSRLRVLAVNEQPVNSLEAFAEAVSDAGNSVRLRLRDLDGRETLRVVSQPEPVWPFGLVERAEQRWQFRSLSQ